MDNQIIYKVNIILNTKEKTEKAVIQDFNKKLLKLILSLEKSSKVNCQM